MHLISSRLKDNSVKLFWFSLPLSQGCRTCLFFMPKILLRPWKRSMQQGPTKKWYRKTLFNFCTFVEPFEIVPFGDPNVLSFLFVLLYAGPLHWSLWERECFWGYDAWRLEHLCDNSIKCRREQLGDVLPRNGSSTSTGIYHMFGRLI